MPELEAIQCFQGKVSKICGSVPLHLPCFGTMPVGLSYLAVEWKGPEAGQPWRSLP